MKNLKKILMALLLVALMVSAVATVAIAEASYTGTVAEAEILLNEAIAADGDVATAKTEPLKKLYQFLLTVNPEDEGYDAIKDSYNQMTFKVAHHLYEKVDVKKDATLAEKEAIAAAITNVHLHIAAAPVIRNGSEPVLRSEGFECETCGRYRDFTDEEYYNGITGGTMCPGTCSKEEQKLVYTADADKSSAYDEFEKELNDVTLAFAADVTAYLYGLTGEKLEGTATYYEVREARKAVLDYLAEVKREEYKAPVSTIYTGDATIAMSMIKNYGEDSTFAELKEVLADVYGYLLATPVNPMSDEFASFLAEYNALGAILIEKLGEEVDACDEVDGKIEIMADFRDYLNGTDGTQISEKVVKLFNEYRAAFIKTYRDADEVVSGVESLDARVPAAVALNSDLTAFNAKIAELEAAEAITEDDIAALYAFVSTGVIDPAAEGYATAIEKYVSLCVGYAEANYVEEYYATETLEEELDILNAFLAFIEETPLCEAVTDMYSDLLYNMIGRAKAITEVIDLGKLPAYEEEKKATTSVGAVLDAMLGDVKAAYDVYADEETEADAKATALEAAKTALLTLGVYIEGNGIDTALNAGFVAEYNAIRQNIANALLDTVNNAEEDKKEEALAAVKAYFASAPVLTASVRAYNELVAELVTDEAKKAELTLNNVYIEAFGFIDAIVAEDATLEGMLLNAAALAECDRQYVDVTDELYAEYVTARGNAYAKVASSIGAALPEELEKATAEECVEIIEKYVSYADSINVSIIIEGVNAALTAEKEEMDSLVLNLEKNPYRTEAEKFFAEIEKFDAAETFAAKLEAFKAIFKIYYNADFITTELMLDSSYETLESEYARVSGELEAAILSYIGSFVDPNELIAALKELHGYITEVPFSEAVIDSYTAERESLIDIKFGESADRLEANCGEAEYATPDNFSGYFARVNLALDLAKKEDGVSDEFAVAYNILSGIAGVEGPDYAPKPIDFGAEELVATLESLAEVKTTYEKIIETSFANDTLEEKKETLKALGEFVKKYPYSKALHDFYYDSCESCVSNYRKTATEKATAFEPLVNLLHSYLENCTVKTELLGVVEKSRYQTISTLAEISQLVMVEEALDAFWELPDAGDFDLIYENLAYDNINSYMEGYGLTDTNDSKIASAVMKFAFEEYLIKFIAELENEENEETKDREIAYRGRKFASDKYPAELITLYKNAFNLTDLKAVPSTAEKTAGDVVTLLLKAEAIDFTESTESMATALTAVVNYANSVNFSTNGVLESIQENSALIKADLDAKTQAQIKLLETKSKVEEQSNPVLYDYDHETSTGLTGTVSGSGKPSHTLVSDGNNKYAAMTIHSGDSNCFRATTIKDLPAGVVIEMDIMSPGDFSFQIEENNLGEMLFVFQNGVLQKEFSNYGPDADDIKLVPTQWTHLTVIVDCDAMTVEVLIDYVSVGTKALKGTDRFKTLRITSKPALLVDEKGEITKTKAPVSVNCYDNIKIYSGTAYRTLGKVMTTEEQFNNSVLAMLDTTLSKVDRARAYYTAFDLYDLVGAECKENKDKFDAFDAETLKREGSQEALSAILELENMLNIEEMTTADVTATEQTIAKIQSKIELNRLVLDQTDENLLRINKEIIEANEKIVWLSNLSTAVSHLGRFHRATTLASITKHYNLFKTYYDICELEKPANMEAAEKDPVCANFINGIAGDAAVNEILDEITFASYCEVYINERIGLHNDANNSIKILDCIDFVKTIAQAEETFESTEAYYAELVAQANLNYDYVETYLAIIRNVIKAGAYVDSEAEYPGITKAVEIFLLLDEEFSKILKETQYATIAEKLERYNETTSYIEKAGICTFLENFILENAVDLSDEQGLRYRTIIDACKEELGTYIEDYESVLVANTEAFIATVEKMKTYVTYKELKPLYEEAMNQYYYSMNVDSEAARAAVETFIKYQEMILNWEENSALFIGYVSNLKSARRQAQKFRALVNCMNCIDGISEDVSGVTAALKTYNEGLAAYNEDIAPANSEIAEVSDVVCSLRTHSVSATILAIIQSLMK